MIIINTGNGKGKTTAAMGQILRSLGHGFKVCLIQLFKSESFYGEQKILTKLDNLDFFSFAKEHPNCVKGISPEEVITQCAVAMRKIKEIADNNKKYDLIVLEEFTIALRDKFIDENEFITFVKQLSQKSDVIVTGRSASWALIDAADLVTEMKEIKHPHNRGIQSRKGIEY
ncbi:cob(I)alamin adenosyltransferase [Endomicrobiia bacterium]|nr:cob(I)alamin adenosyltransferase [Endomicrobiia bacterium]GHT66793.1 cob(I)alamin adenosyltransferase [Endomicrobiia bacterium]GHT71985.1 cob(I)alamin adenosyltransferase [Endomicrobiia bacterium]GHT74737.1 cob(I)alamin adenosyltransferase [Endomicrobiia bacterium]